MRILLTIEYNGKRYEGWQAQPSGNTVQQTVEKAVFALTGEEVDLIASGRTDAGVHAEGQKAHFDTNTTIPAEKFYKALNPLLPDDIKIISSQKVSDDFHARYWAKRKTYVYSVYVSDVERPLKEDFAVRIDKYLDEKKMQAAMDEFVGIHDFKCCLSSGSQVKNTQREIYYFNLIKTADGYRVEVCGNGFLYNMVRIMVGTVIKAGEGKITAEEIKNALLSGDRKSLGKTMPAKGLCLKSVEYFDNQE